jgi:hypothetical protein
MVPGALKLGSAGLGMGMSSDHAHSGVMARLPRHLTNVVAEGTTAPANVASPKTFTGPVAAERAAALRRLTVR